ncbi:recombination protein NinB [Roseixanthobacter pseudopolyaromaticivorans]|uniref:recombination protein NinB n=1 Tax=Xanthobacteraceae TaxID=335928 RepID=UPI00372BE3D2
MSRALVILQSETDRNRAANWARKAPPGTRVEFKQPKRTTDQNARMWAMLTDIARQLPWHGVKLSPDDWKLIFLDALKREMRLAPNLDGTGFVNLGRSSSDLSKSEMSDLMELMSEFGARHGVVWSDPKDTAFSKSGAAA